MTNTDTTTTDTLKATAEIFLSQWDRHVWQQDHGEWASERGQALPDDSDFIAGGKIDPDDLAVGAVNLEVGEEWEGWDCRESWDLYRSGTTLILRWHRQAWGDRLPRDLWVVVDPTYFTAD